MEFLVLIGALVTLDVLALKFGADSRDNGVTDRHQRAIDAIRGGNAALYQSELRAFEDELRKRALF
jgi:hypothetical protein